MREAIPEDLEFDPNYTRQRRVSSYLLGLAINGLRGSRTIWEKPVDRAKLADDIQKIALEQGIVAFDPWHHAPLCRANNWSKQALPTGPCTCGAERHKIK